MSKVKIVQCKVCGAEIASNAKTCPHCGAKNKKKRPVLFILIGVIVFFAIISGISGGSDSEKNGNTASDSPAAAASKSAATTAPVKTDYGVGEPAEEKNITVTLVNVTESTGSAYNRPTEGNVFLICEFEIENDSSKEISVSSLVSFDAYCDDYACNFSLNALLEKGNKNQLDGTVAVGKKFNGVVGYEVAADWKEFEIHFTPDFWFGKDIIFVTNHE